MAAGFSLQNFAAMLVLAYVYHIMEYFRLVGWGTVPVRGSLCDFQQDKRRAPDI